MDFLKKIKNFEICLILVLLLLFPVKIYFNNFLMAENGDTYDFFKISYQLSQGNLLYESKRLPLYPLLLAPFNPEDYALYGRIINNLIFFLSIYVFYKIISLKFSLNNLEKFLFILIFSFNFITFDNSFYILSDSLLLLFVILFFYFYEKTSNPLLLAFLAGAAFYTRFEGIVLVFAYLVTRIFNKDFRDLFKFTILFLVISAPLLLKFYLDSKIGSSYLSDEVGFTLSMQNILKALGSVFFATGGFWLMSVSILDKNTHEIAKNPIKFLIRNLSNLYLISFLFFTTLLVLWGFFIRLYSVLAFLSIVYLIYLYKNKFENSKKYFLLLFPLTFYLLNVQILNHFDLGYFKLSKFISFVLSLTFVYVFILKKKSSVKLILLTLIILIINLSIFFEKFIETRLKYQTIVQASLYVTENNLRNVAYFDESGVQKWYLKDFTGKYQYFDNTYPLNLWLIENKIEYLMISDEMGYKIAQIKELNEEIKQLELTKEFTSNYVGGKTLIYKLDKNRIF